MPAQTLGVIEDLAADESAAWVEALFTQFESEGRLIEGGWPGTVSEARRRLMTRIAANPSDAPERGELDRLVDLIYAKAKQRWLQVSRS